MREPRSPSEITSCTRLWLAVTVTAVLVAGGAEAQEPPQLDASPERGRAKTAGVLVHRDTSYVPDGHERQTLDLFVPTAGPGPFPLILWVHGGGWQRGSKENCLPLRQGWLERGYAIASLNYRLSSEAVFPAQIEDCKTAVRWLRAHAAKYNLDPDRFGAWGSSAGGHLAALLGTAGGLPEFDVGAHLDQSSRVQAVCNYYGPTDFEAMSATPGYETHATATSAESRLIGGPVLDNLDAARRASPITYVTTAAPPFLIVHGDRDPVVPIDQSRRLFQALTEAGVSTHFHTIRGARHGQGFDGPEILPMVAEFFARHLRSSELPPRGESKTTQSEPPNDPLSPARPARQDNGRPRISPQGPTFPFESMLRRHDRDGDGRISRDEFRGPPPVFDRLDADRDGFITREEHEATGRSSPPPEANAIVPEAEIVSQSTAAVSGGLLYFAQYRHQDNTAPIANPHIIGALFTLYWSEVETGDGVFDWRSIDRRIAPWIDAGKKVVLRIMWSSSGAWPDPAARRPTPTFVLDNGAVALREEATDTEIPLFWDPVYRRYANRFLHEVARKFDGNSNILFIDVTPGAETNPYRFRRINDIAPEFRQTFAQAVASDGRHYSHELWLDTMKQAVDDAAAIFRETPLLVTLNAGSLDGPNQMVAIGDYCVFRGCYVGQNGLTERSYETDSQRQAAFMRWGQTTKLYFEMLDASGGGTGTLMDVMQAAERIGCDYLGVYAVDVLRGTKGQPTYDPQFEAALAYGAKELGNQPTAPPAAKVPTAAAANIPVGAAGEFQLNGDRWTYREGEFVMSGILLKPEGKGPFPAVLISHGLGGSAESFGLTKAHEMVKWGFVCMAPSFTHSAGARGNRQDASTKAGTPTKGGRGRQHPDDYGASAENLRRARMCLDLLSHMQEVDAKRLFAYGHSMGGFVTIGLAAAEPDRLQAAAITGSGITPQEGFPAPSAARVEQVRTPFLILHGSADPVVRPQQSADFKGILDKNHVPNERIVYEGEGHPIDQTQRERVFAAVRAWFEKHGAAGPDEKSGPYVYYTHEGELVRDESPVNLGSVKKY